MGCASFSVVAFDILQAAMIVRNFYDMMCEYLECTEKPTSSQCGLLHDIKKLKLREVSKLRQKTVKQKKSKNEQQCVLFYFIV